MWLWFELPARADEGLCVCKCKEWMQKLALLADMIGVCTCLYLDFYRKWKVVVAKRKTAELFLIYYMLFVVLI